MNLKKIFKTEIKEIKKLENKKEKTQKQVIHRLQTQEEICDLYEDLYGFDCEETIQAYEEYELLRVPLTNVENELLSAKKDLAEKVIKIGENNGIKYDKMALNNVVCLEMIADIIVSA